MAESVTHSGDAARVLLRRLWWATLPYWGWTAGTVGQRVDDILDGARPAPLWAYPLAWLNRAANFLLGSHDVFGPRWNAWSRRPLVGSRRPQSWQ